MLVMSYTLKESGNQLEDIFLAWCIFRVRIAIVEMIGGGVYRQAL